MFGLRKKDSDMATAQANILALQVGLGRLAEKVNENEVIATTFASDVVILFDMYNELNKRITEIEDARGIGAGDGTDF